MQSSVKSILSILTLSIFMTSCASGVKLHFSAVNTLPPAILGESSKLKGSMRPISSDAIPDYGYFTVPRTAFLHGSIILIHDKNGLNERIKRLADDFAAEGYSVLAIDLYKGKSSDTDEISLADEQRLLEDKANAYRILNNAASFLRSQERSNGKIALIGWSVGASIALNFSMDIQTADGTALFYADLPKSTKAFYKIRHEIYATYTATGLKGDSNFFNRVKFIQREVGSYSDIYVYEDVDPEFWLYVDNNRKRNSWAAEDAWIRLKAYLERTISPSSEIYEQKKL